MALDLNGKFVFVPNEVSNDISAYRIASDGARQRRGHPGDESLNDMDERVNARSRRDLGGQAIRKHQTTMAMSARMQGSTTPALFPVAGSVREGDERIRFGGCRIKPLRARKVQHPTFCR
jgi:hypothetical protein